MEILYTVLGWYGVGVILAAIMISFANRRHGQRLNDCFRPYWSFVSWIIVLFGTVEILTQEYNLWGRDFLYKIFNYKQ